MAGPEKAIEQPFTDWCWEKNKLVARKLVEAGRNSWPDRSIILPGGRIVCIEFKAPNGSLSRGQEVRIKELRALGVPVLVTSNTEEAKRWLLEQM